MRCRYSISRSRRRGSSFSSARISSRAFGSTWRPLGVARTRPRFPCGWVVTELRSFMRSFYFRAHAQKLDTNQVPAAHRREAAGGGTFLLEQDPSLFQRDPDAPEYRHAHHEPGRDDEPRRTLLLACRNPPAHGRRPGRLVRELALRLQLRIGHEMLVRDRLDEPVADEADHEQAAQDVGGDVVQL